MKVRRVKLKDRIAERGSFLLRVGPFDDGEKVFPGQFFELKWPRAYEPLLPRPFSLFFSEGEDLFFLVKERGRFTHSLLEAPIGKELSLFGPLGNPFPREEAHLVGGGTGLAPLFLFSRLWPEKVKSFLVGFETRPPDFILRCFDRLSVPFCFSTEDGSFGERGTVIDLLRQRHPSCGTVFACGPKGMLNALEKTQKGARILVSLESFMACGTGICMGCAISKREGEGYLRVCSDGPVFSLSEIQL